MRRGSWIKAGALAAGCAAVGAVAGIAGGAASPNSAGKPQAGAPHWRMHRGLERGGPPIHSESVVPKRSGSGFETVTDDNGKLKSRSGNDITITEGTQSQTYKDVTVTIPSDATILRNGAKASLGDLKDGDFVHVSQSPEGTFVMAADKNFRPRFQGGRRGFGHGRGGPPPPGAPPPPPYGP
jgi:hypothetical protein